MKGPTHDHNRQGNIAIIVLAGYAKSRNVADRDLGDILDDDGDAVHLCQNDVLDVVDLVALRQVVGATAVDETHTTDVDRLLAHGDLAAAHVDIGVTQGGDDLRYGDAVAVKLMQIDLDVVLLGGPSPRIDLNHTWNGKQTACDDPILDGAQIGQAEVLRAEHLIANHFANQA